MKCQVKKQRQCAEDEQGAHESRLRGRFQGISEGVNDPHAAWKILVARVFWLKISQADTNQGLVALHVEGIHHDVLAVASPPARALLR